MKRCLVILLAFLCLSSFSQLYPLHPWPSAKWTEATNGLIIGVNVPESAVNVYTNLAIFAKGATSAYAQRWIVPRNQFFTLRIVGSDGLEPKPKRDEVVSLPRTREFSDLPRDRRNLPIGFIPSLTSETPYVLGWLSFSNYLLKPNTTYQVEMKPRLYHHDGKRVDLVDFPALSFSVKFGDVEPPRRRVSQ